MQFFEFIAARADTGAVLPGAQITVKVTGTNTLAALFDQADAAVSNPFTATASGEVGIAAANGAYDITIASNDGTYTLPPIRKVQFYDLTGLDAQVALATDARLDAAAKAQLAADWAEKATAPGAVGTKSAKSWTADAQTFAALAATNATPAGVSIDARLDPTAQLFDKDAALLDTVIVASSGTTSVASGLLTTGKIQLAPGQQFICNRIILQTSGRGIVYYDSAGNRLSSVTGADVAAGTAITAPATAGLAYARFSVQTNSSRFAMLVVHGVTLPSVYKTFGIDRHAQHNQTQKLTRAANGETNRFSPDRAQVGFSVTAATGAYTAVAARYATDDMPVLDGENLYLSHISVDGSPYGFTFFNVDKEVVGSTIGPFGASNGTTNAAGYAVGATSITLASGGTGKVAVGDGVMFGADPNMYVVTAGDANIADGGTIAIAGAGLIVAIPTVATAMRVYPVVAYPFGTAYARGGFRSSDVNIRDLRITGGTAPVAGPRYFGSVDRFSSQSQILTTLTRALPIHTNLFDAENYTDGFIIRANLGTIDVSAGYGMSAIMMCIPGGKVITNQMLVASPYGIAFYDINGIFLPNVGITGVTAGVAYDVPPNAYGWVVSFVKDSTTAPATTPGEQNNIKYSSYKRLYCGLGTTLPVGTFAATDVADFGRLKKWRGKKVITLGDSITRMGRWQGALSDYLDTPIINYGVDGSKASDFLTNAMVAAGPVHSVGVNGYGVTSADFVDADLVICGVGANDWGAQVPIGTVLDAPSTTPGVSFIGNVRQAIKTIQSWRPDGKMAMMFWGPGHWTTMTTITGKPIKLTQYVEAARTACAEEGVAHWDSYAQSGIGPGNYVAGTPTQPAGSSMADEVHVSNFGGSTYLGPRMGRFIERTL